MAVKDMTNTKSYRRVKDAFVDSKKWFPEYRETAISGIQLTLQIVAAIRERCDPGRVEAHEAYEFMLDKIERDCKIHFSRLNYLQDNFSRCERIAAKVRGGKNVDMMEDWINSYIKWFNERRDFHNAFRKSDGEWKRAEGAILEALDNE